MQGLNPMSAMNDIRDATMKAQEVFIDITQTQQKDSLEAQNRDSCKTIATKFNDICKEKNKLGRFVFMSAEASIIGDASPQTRKYVEMKREAETFLLDECD